MEHLIQMGPMLALAGLFVGWLAETLHRPGGYGFLNDVMVGLAGSVMAGVLFWTVISTQVGMAPMFVIGAGGAALAIIVQRRFWRSARSPA